MITRKLVAFTGLTLALTLSAAAQSAAPLSFEVAEIKPSADLTTIIASHQVPKVGTHVDAQRVEIDFTSLQQLIVTAYAVKPYQVTGPDWLSSTRFDIQATLPPGATPDQLPAMLQSLLASRFGLTLHHTTETLPVYALIVGKNGPHLAPATPPPAPTAPATPPPAGSQTIDTANGGTATVSRGPAGSANIQMQGGPFGAAHLSVTSEGMNLVADSMTMPVLADTITPMLDRPVIDMTDLKGAYTVSLAVSRDDLQAIARAAAAKMGLSAAMTGMATPGGGAAAGSGATVASDPGGSSVIASIQKLGLKLDARKAPVDCLVVDHINQTPTAN